MHDTTLVGESHVGTSQDVIGDGLTEDFYAEDVGDAAIVRLISGIGNGDRNGLTFPLSRAPDPGARLRHGRCSR